MIIEMVNLLFYRQAWETEVRKKCGDDKRKERKTFVLKENGNLEIRKFMGSREREAEEILASGVLGAPGFPASRSLQSTRSHSLSPHWNCRWK